MIDTSGDKPTTEDTAEAPVKAQPKQRKAKTYTYMATRNGQIEGKSGKVYPLVIGEEFGAPAGELNHAFDTEGNSRCLVKK